MTDAQKALALMTAPCPCGCHTHPAIRFLSDLDEHAKCPCHPFRRMTEKLPEPAKADGERNG
jgi:hypothetical protein